MILSSKLPLFSQIFFVVLRTLHKYELVVLSIRTCTVAMCTLCNQWQLGTYVTYSIASSSQYRRHRLTWLASLPHFNNNTLDIWEWLRAPR